MKQMLLSDVLQASGERMLTRQAADGSVPGGCNGPYRDEETPVRNTAHTLILWADLYRRTGDPAFKAASGRAVEFLAGSKARPGGFTFHCRNTKDRCNGLVGQAWAMEALLFAHEVFEWRECYRLAESVYLLHPFDPSVRLWHRVETDGADLSYDNTFNHQLWFAAAASLLAETPRALEEARGFLDHVAAKVSCYETGVIFHSSPMGGLAGHAGNGAGALLQQCRQLWKSRRKKSGLYGKSVGYHAFNLYAYALLRQTIPEAACWRRDVTKRMLRATEDEAFLNELDQSPFGFLYNVSGIEIAFALEVFGGDARNAESWLNRQWERTFLSPERPLARGAVDENTADARIYEAVRLKKDYEVTHGPA